MGKGPVIAGPFLILMIFPVCRPWRSAPALSLSRCVTLLAGCRIRFTALLASLHADLPIVTPT